MRLKIIAPCVVLCLAAGGAALALWPHKLGASTGSSAPWVNAMALESYTPQQVIYHVDQPAGLFNGHFRHVLQVAGNHVDALEQMHPGHDRLDLRIVLQSEGVDLLAWAKGNPAVQEKITKLKARGVRFLVCRNTLINRGINPDRDLFDVHHDDVIRAAVAEIAALEQKGFQYLKP